MICRNCGNTTDDGILFCPYCGKKIEEIIDLEKKTAAVNDVFASSETTAGSHGNGNAASGIRQGSGSERRAGTSRYTGTRFQQRARVGSPADPCCPRTAGTAA